MRGFEHRVEDAAFEHGHKLGGLHPAPGAEIGFEGFLYGRLAG